MCIERTEVLFPQTQPHVCRGCSACPTKPRMSRLQPSPAPTPAQSPARSRAPVPPLCGRRARLLLAPLSVASSTAVSPALPRLPAWPPQQQHGGISGGSSAAGEAPWRRSSEAGREARHAGGQLRRVRETGAGCEAMWRCGAPCRGPGG